uniref:Uncharacterized protein TCIL3000_11_10500 n=1 Tax=Trypanosoma congolense (strain IL3000) TaxID=1068625 RepID=G0V1Q6_TRYCI|nr:unnamed protein product [Trypanosoma congolense IL3000]
MCILETQPSTLFIVTMSCSRWAKLSSRISRGFKTPVKISRAQSLNLNQTTVAKQQREAAGRRLSAALLSARQQTQHQPSDGHTVQVTPTHIRPPSQKEKPTTTTNAWHTYASPLRVGLWLKAGDAGEKVVQRLRIVTTTGERDAKQDELLYSHTAKEEIYKQQWQPCENAHIITVALVTTK